MPDTVNPVKCLRAGEVTDPRGEFIVGILLSGIWSHFLLDISVYTCKIVLLSALVRKKFFLLSVVDNAEIHNL